MLLGETFFCCVLCTRRWIEFFCGWKAGEIFHALRVIRRTCTCTKAIFPRARIPQPSRLVKIRHTLAAKKLNFPSEDADSTQEACHRNSKSELLCIQRFYIFPYEWLCDWGLTVTDELFQASPGDLFVGGFWVEEAPLAAFEQRQVDSVQRQHRDTRVQQNLKPTGAQLCRKTCHQCTRNSRQQVLKNKTPIWSLGDQFTTIY